jgi:hypothetical protein
MLKLIGEYYEVVALDESLKLSVLENQVLQIYVSDLLFRVLLSPTYDTNFMAFMQVKFFNDVDTTTYR